MLKKINIEEKLCDRRDHDIKGQTFDTWLQGIFSSLDRKHSHIREKIKSSAGEIINDLDFDRMDTHKIFHIDQIRKICIDYRLRFLDTKYFKGDLPAGAIAKINAIEEEHNTELDGFKIMAPSKLFVLKKADDPLLFIPIGNDYYYLVYKWGNDLHPLRRALAWPTKNVGNLTFTLFVSCILLTLLSANFIFNDKTTGPYIVMLFLFYFKFAVGFLLFYGIASGKNFNEYIWQSKYNKIS